MCAFGLSYLTSGSINLVSEPGWVMVKSKMKNRMENVEKEMRNVKEDMGTMKTDLGSVKEYLTEMRELMRLREEKEEKRYQEKMFETPENQNSSRDKGYERNHNGDNGKDDKKIRKLKQPIFNGDDPFGSTFKGDRYFAINRYEEKEIVEVAAMCMEGKALNGINGLNPRDQSRVGRTSKWL